MLVTCYVPEGLKGIFILAFNAGKSNLVPDFKLDWTLKIKTSEIYIKWKFKNLQIASAVITLCQTSVEAHEFHIISITQHEVATNGALFPPSVGV